MSTIRLDARSLNSKSGFEDGDVIGEMLMDIYPGTIGEPKDLKPPTFPEFSDIWSYGFEHVVLYKLVERNLLPFLPGRELMFIHTIHNPVRFVDWSRDATTPDIHVDVPFEEVSMVAKWVETEWREGRSGMPEVLDE